MKHDWRCVGNYETVSQNNAKNQKTFLIDISTLISYSRKKLRYSTLFQPAFLSLVGPMFPRYPGGSVVTPSKGKSLTPRGRWALHLATGALVLDEGNGTKSLVRFICLKHGKTTATMWRCICFPGFCSNMLCKLFAFHLDLEGNISCSYCESRDFVVKQPGSRGSHYMTHDREISSRNLFGNSHFP